MIYAAPVTGEGITDKRAVKYEEHLRLHKSQDIFSALGDAPRFSLRATPCRSSLMHSYSSLKRSLHACTDVGCQDYLCYTFSTFLMKRTPFFASFSLLRLMY